MCTGWRRPIGCRNMYVTFHKRATDYRALLEKKYEEKWPIKIRHPMGLCHPVSYTARHVMNITNSITNHTTNSIILVSRPVAYIYHLVDVYPIHQDT